MPSPLDVLNKLQTHLFINQMKVNIEEEIDDINKEYKTFENIPSIQQEQDKEHDEELAQEEPNEEIDSTDQIGRTFELKKIYSRLTSIESYLEDSSDTTLLELRNYVSQSIELFDLLIANIDSFKDKIDEIIILYYNFVEIVYNLLKNFYEGKEKKAPAVI